MSPRHITLSAGVDYFLWWDENDGVEAGIIYGDGGYLDGRGQSDHIEGDAGSDIIVGEGGNDVLFGGKPDPDGRLAGYWGNDTLIGGGGDDTLVAGAGNDILYGDYESAAPGTGNDAIYAGGGNDTIYTGFGAGNDYAEGNGGNDTFFDQGGGTDRYFGGDGFDTLSYAQSTMGLFIHLQYMNGTGIATGDSYDSIERILGSNFNDEIYGYQGDDTLEGLDGNDRIQGYAGSDKLFGGTGNDTLIGGLSADDLNGGAGADWASYRDATSMVIADFLYGGTTGEAAGDRYYELENLEGSNSGDHLGGNDVANEIQGGYGNDRIGGRGGNDRLFGGSGDDYLAGDSGADYLDGGAGEDMAAYDGATGAVFVDFLNPWRNSGEAAGDTFMLVENIAGSRFRDILVADGNENKLYGGAGSDDLYGLGGADILYGDEGDDVLEGGAGEDAIAGGIGNDTIRGGSGIDYMWGNAGDDHYEVTEAGDTVIENANEGRETVFANINYVLTANVEDLIQFGSGSTSGTGNELANGIRGNDQANILSGLDGADVIDGGLGNDKIIGGKGLDTLYGGAGDDRIYVDNAGDVVVEQANGGVDQVYASVNYALAASVAVEKLSTTDAAGTSSIKLTGNDLAQTIYGNRGANTLDGGAGNDKLLGGSGGDKLVGGSGSDTASYAGASKGVVASLANPLINTSDAKGDTYFSIEKLIGSSHVDKLTGSSGNNSLDGGIGLDVLTGGLGSDRFIFSTAPKTANADTISDFSVKDDTLQFELDVFKALGTSVTSSEFRSNSTGLAEDTSDNLIYEKDTGELYFDSNGSASGGSVLVALLAKNLALTYLDFDVI